MDTRVHVHVYHSVDWEIFMFYLSKNFKYDYFIDIQIIFTAESLVYQFP